MTSYSLCRLCSQGIPSVLFTIPNACPNISYLPKHPTEDKSLPLYVFECPSCGFVQLLHPSSQVDYEDYFMAVSFSKQMQECQEEQIKSLEKVVDISGWEAPIDILEIGCGDGGFIQNLLASKHFNITAIEPSKIFYEHAKQVHSEIYNCYLDQFISDRRFQIIVAREVLEHIYDIHSFLNLARAYLIENGWIMVQVPRLETAYEEARVQTFFFDHVNYFSEDTLCLALEMHGFRIHEVCRDMGGEYTTVYARRIEELEWKNIFDNWKQSIELLKEKICTILDKGKVVLWGAGGKGLSTLAAMDLPKNDNLILVDCDKMKIGRYTPVTNLLIQDSEILKWLNPKLVVILADAYREEICEKLRKIDYTGTTTYLGDKE